MKSEAKIKGVYLGLPKCNGDALLKDFRADKICGKNQVVLGEIGERRKVTVCLIKEAINNGENVLFIDPKLEYEKVQDIDFNILIYEEEGDL
ncbi:hypothetical protein LNN31_08415 [Acetobacterium wieringae]|uniref:Uncharacterized protein n=1 Tax=Acetobacterium wieringae TaxID=52694 RepID=A0ABY6HIQ8_9FIRM|nr:hypothetical protein [Acetobacterium wieringae]UYO64432.1 hypothetical protein LNN31_08415 [Acetobacterium wieringae]VUZ22944.1 Uncharacterised protein [Acetobacterium wieringae]